MFGSKPIWEAEWQNCIKCGQPVMTTAGKEDALCDECWYAEYRPRPPAICPYCNEPIGAEPFEWDHIIPKSQGGKSTPDNLVLCHLRCNRRKRGRTPREWLGHDVDFSKATFWDDGL